MPRARVDQFFFWALSISLSLPPPHRVSVFDSGSPSSPFFGSRPPSPRPPTPHPARFTIPEESPGAVWPRPTPRPLQMTCFHWPLRTPPALPLANPTPSARPPSSPLWGLSARAGAERGGAASGGVAIRGRGRTSRPPTPPQPRPVPSQSSRASPAEAATAPRRRLYGFPTVGPTDRPRRAGEGVMPGRLRFSAHLGGHLDALSLSPPVPVRIPA